MPLEKGTSKKVRNRNYVELIMNPIESPARRKAIRTIMRRRKVSYEKAKRIQALAITQSKKNG